MYLSGDSASFGKICKCPAIDMSDVCGYDGDPAVGDLFGKAVPASVPGENCTFAVSGVCPDAVPQESAEEKCPLYH